MNLIRLRRALTTAALLVPVVTSLGPTQPSPVAAHDTVRLHQASQVASGAARAGAGTKGPRIPGTDAYDAAEALPAGYRAAGSRRDWSSLFGRSTVRWDPCSVIRWRYNGTGAAYQARPDVTRAIAKISGVTGLKFTYVGRTSFSYRGQRSSSFPANADLVVSWASGSTYGVLRGNAVGVGGGFGTSAGAGELGVDFRMTAGYLTLDSGARMARGFGGQGWGQVMLHETLHALGLGHAKDLRDRHHRPVSRQLMAPMATALNVSFGAGDLTGMHRIGARAGDHCAW